MSRWQSGRDLEADPVMETDAEEAIVTEAAAEAAVDVAGYSDELLVAELRGILEAKRDDGPVLQAVVHRDDRSSDPVYVAEGHEGWRTNQALREFYRQFDWLNDEKLASTLEVGDLTFMTASFDDTRMLRYLASETRETAIFIDPEHPLHLPPFERQVATLVNAKWGTARARPVSTPDRPGPAKHLRRDS